MREYSQATHDDFEYIEKNVSTAYKYMKCEGAIAMLESSKLLFKNPSSFNDPYDCYLGLIKFDNIENYKKHIESRAKGSMKDLVLIKLLEKSDEELSQLMQDAMKKQFSRIGITCFSEHFRNLLMWSHYSDSHKGVCYSTEEVEPFINCFRTKSEDWQFEKEIRMVVFQANLDANKQVHIPFIKDIIMEVYLGRKIYPNDEEKIINICIKDYPHTKIFKMKLDNTKFNLIPEEIKQ